eukprot:TRINITY_DN15774_c0_g1_i1.p1 TRINITY_DN15774_c0_g1~~TRINITY_DN15774_c0_g1_i1.p1  ORF type:complete len:738 (+),score=127.03 TRINITY_DN15774_c0_g1_i1:44-2257(+)
MDLLDLALSGNADQLLHSLQDSSRQDADFHVDKMRDRSGYSLLHLATTSGSIESVRIVLSFDANPNISTPSHHWTPLHIAAHHNFASIVMILCGCGANRDSKDSHGRTAAKLATDPSVIDFLENGLQITDELWSPSTYSRLWLDASDTYYVRVQMPNKESAIGVLLGWETSESSSHHKHLLKIHIMGDEPHEVLVPREHVSHISQHSSIPTDMHNQPDAIPMKTQYATAFPDSFSTPPRRKPKDPSSYLHAPKLLSAPITNSITNYASKQNPLLSSFAPIPFLRAEGLMWRDSIGFLQFENLLGHEALSVARAIDRHGFDVWFTGALVTELLSLIYETPTLLQAGHPLLSEKYRLPHYRRVLVTTCPLLELERLAHIHGWPLLQPSIPSTPSIESSTALVDSTKLSPATKTSPIPQRRDENPSVQPSRSHSSAGMLLLPFICIRTLAPSGHPPVFCDPCLAPTALSLYYHPIHRTLYDPYGCGIKDCFIRRASLPSVPYLSAAQLIRHPELLARSLLLLSRYSIKETNPERSMDGQHTPHQPEMLHDPQFSGQSDQNMPNSRSSQEGKQLHPAHRYISHPDHHRIIAAMQISLRLFPKTLVQAFAHIRHVDLARQSHPRILAAEIFAILAPLVSHSTSLQTLQRLIVRADEDDPMVATPWRISSRPLHMHEQPTTPPSSRLYPPTETPIRPPSRADLEDSFQSQWPETSPVSEKWLQDIDSAYQSPITSPVMNQACK